MLDRIGINARDGQLKSKNIAAVMLSCRVLVEIDKMGLKSRERKTACTLMFTFL